MYTDESHLFFPRASQLAAHGVQLLLDISTALLGQREHAANAGCFRCRGLGRPLRLFTRNEKTISSCQRMNCFRSRIVKQMREKNAWNKCVEQMRGTNA